MASMDAAYLTAEVPQLVETGEKLYVSGCYADARNEWERALELAKHTKDVPNEMHTLNLVHRASKQMGDLQYCATVCEERLRRARELGNRFEESRALGSLGGVHQACGHHQLAMECFRQQLIAAKNCSNRREVAVAMGRIGETHYNLREDRMALQVFQDCATMAHEANDWSEEARIIGVMADVHVALKNNEEAEECHTSRLRLVREKQLESREELRAMADLGNFHCTTGDVAKGLAILRGMVELARQRQDNHMESRGLRALARAHEANGAPKKALDAMERRLKIAQDFGDIVGESEAFSALGEIWFRFGHDGQALYWHNEQLSHARMHNNIAQQIAALEHVAACHSGGGNESASIEHNMQRLNLCVKVGNEKGEMKAKSDLAESYHRMGDLSRAQNLFNEVWRWARSNGDYEEEFRCVSRLTQLHMQMGEVSRAMELLNELSQMALHLQDTHMQTKALLYLGQLHFSQDNFSPALQAFQQALDLARTMNDHEQMLAALESVALAHFAMGYEVKGKEFLKQLLDLQPVRNITAFLFKMRSPDRSELKDVLDHFKGIYKAMKDGKDPRFVERDISLEATCLDNIILAYHVLGEYEKETANAHARLVLVRESQDTWAEMDTMGTLSNALYLSGQHTEAYAVLQEHLSLAQYLGDRHTEARALGAMCLCLQALNNFDSALEVGSEYLRVTKEMGDRQAEANALEILGETFRTSGDFERAMEYWNLQLASCRQRLDRRGEFETLGRMADAELERSRVHNAMEYQRKQIDLAREMGDARFESSAVESLSYSHQIRGNHLQALQMCQTQLEKARQPPRALHEEVMWIEHLGNCYLNMKDFDKALASFVEEEEMAKQIGDRKSIARSLGNMGQVYHNKEQYLKAIDYFQRQVNLARKQQDKTAEATALDKMGQSYLELGDYAKVVDIARKMDEIAKKLLNRKLADRAKLLREKAEKRKRDKTGSGGGGLARGASFKNLAVRVLAVTPSLPVAKKSLTKQLRQERRMTMGFP